MSDRGIYSLAAALDEIDALEARLRKLNAENAALNDENRDLLEKWSERGARAEAAEARVAALREALHEIAYADDPPGDTWSEGIEWAGRIARAALAPGGER